jgi:hypothetical protein
MFWLKRCGLTVWLSGSGGTGETLSQLCAISGESRLRGAAEPLSDWSRCWAALFSTADISCVKAFKSGMTASNDLFDSESMLLSALT